MPLVDTKRGKLHYKDYRTGDGSDIPILLIHGAGGDYQDWPIEMRTGLGAIAVDLPGHGKSPIPGRRTIMEYAQDIIAFLDALAISKAVFIGHSMGGAIALTLALDFPMQTHKLILIATGARLPVNEVIINGIVEKPQEIASTIMKWCWSKHLRETYAEQGVKKLLQTPTDIIQNDYLACNEFDVQERLPEITAPALIIAGDQDKMTPLVWAKTMQDAIPDATLLTVEDSGHMVHKEQPARICQKITDWL